MGIHQPGDDAEEELQVVQPSILEAAEQKSEMAMQTAEKSTRELGELQNLFPTGVFPRPGSKRKHISAAEALSNYSKGELLQTIRYFCQVKP